MTRDWRRDSLHQQNFHPEVLLVLHVTVAAMIESWYSYNNRYIYIYIYNSVMLHMGDS